MKTTKALINTGKILKMIHINDCTLLSSIIFSLGVLGFFLNRSNIIKLLISIELILLAVNINFVAFSSSTNNLVGQIFSMFILTVAAAESAIGLAILVIYFRKRQSIDASKATQLKD